MNLKKFRLAATGGAPRTRNTDVNTLESSANTLVGTEATTSFSTNALVSYNTWYTTQKPTSYDTTFFTAGSSGLYWLSEGESKTGWWVTNNVCYSDTFTRNTGDPAQGIYLTCYSGNTTNATSNPTSKYTYHQTLRLSSRNTSRPTEKQTSKPTQVYRNTVRETLI